MPNNQEFDFRFGRVLTFLKKIKGNDPFLAIVQTPKFSTGQEKQAPVNVPFTLFSSTVRFRQHRFEFTRLPALIQICQPTVRRLFIVLTIDTIVIDDTKFIGKVQQQVITGHCPSCEKIIRHPALFELVGKVFVGKDVDKQSAVWLQKSIYFLQKKFVVLHVFEHFNSHHKIVTLYDIQSSFVIGNIASDNLDIVYIVPTGRSGREDVFSLTARVGNACDLGIWKFLCKV
mmetsp:Transcript_26048/g.42686  ORF Transcript_26048/g.42686 Transcript_26048/m.42686 type:complete len:230 (-) Transcript_26048:289-978(-)